MMWVSIMIHYHNLTILPPWMKKMKDKDHDEDNYKEYNYSDAYPLASVLLQLLCLVKNSCSRLHMVNSTGNLPEGRNSKEI